MRDFPGNLQKTNPSRILTEKDHTRSQEFFLILGVIYNDLKGLLSFSNLLKEVYRLPEEKEITVHNGEYGGTNTQINKLACATIHEFFNFLYEYRDVVNTISFKFLLKGLNKERRQEWEVLSNIALNKKADGTNFSQALLEIRNNVGSHYNQSGKTLAKSFINNFFELEKTGTNEYAYYSLGKNMEETRFYFSDAAVSNYYQNRISTTSGYSVKECVENMNKVLAGLLKIYLERR